MFRLLKHFEGCRSFTTAKWCIRINGLMMPFTALDGWWHASIVRQRKIGDNNNRIHCHGDIAPWNTITENGHPKLLVDWDCAGPLDPFVELARVCWLFVQLYDDDLGTLLNLPIPEKRAQQIRIIADGYGLTPTGRKSWLT